MCFTSAQPQPLTIKVDPALHTVRKSVAVAADAKFFSQHPGRFLFAFLMRQMIDDPICSALDQRTAPQSLVYVSLGKSKGGSGLCFLLHFCYAVLLFLRGRNYWQITSAITTSRARFWMLSIRRTHSI